MFIRSIRSETKYTVLSLFSVFPFLFYLHLWAKSSTRRQLPGCSSSLPGLPGPKSGSSFCSNLFISDMLQKEKHCDRSSESTAWHESRSLTKACQKFLKLLRFFHVIPIHHFPLDAAKHALQPPSLPCF